MPCAAAADVAPAADRLLWQRVEVAVDGLVSDDARSSSDVCESGSAGSVAQIHSQVDSYVSALIVQTTMKRLSSSPPRQAGRRRGGAEANAHLVYRITPAARIDDTCCRGTRGRVVAEAAVQVS